MTIIRPGQRIVNIPGIGLRVSRRAVSSGAANWWEAGGAPTPVAVYQPKGAASLAASYINLANPGTYDAAPGVAPTFDAATGWTFNGTDQYLTTGVVPASGWSAIVRFANVSNINSVFNEFDVGAANSRFGILPATTASGGGVGYSAGQVLVVAPTLTTGVLGIAGQQGYRNGIADGGLIGAWGSAATQDVYIGARNREGALVDSYIAADVLAIAIYSTTLTAPQVAAISAAMAAL